MYINCILIGNWQLKNSIDDWLVRPPRKLTVGASGCQLCTKFIHFMGLHLGSTILCVVLYIWKNSLDAWWSLLKTPLGFIGSSQTVSIEFLEVSNSMLDISYGRFSNLMRFHTGSSLSPPTLLPSLQLEVRTSIYATSIDLNNKFCETIILELWYDII